MHPERDDLQGQDYQAGFGQPRLVDLPGLGFCSWQKAKNLAQVPIMTIEAPPKVVDCPFTNPSSLDNEETSVRNDSIPSYGAILRQSHRPEYLAANEIYSIIDKGRPQSRAELLRGCRTNAWFTRHCETGEVRVAANACHLRWCPVCASARRNYISKEVGEWLGESDHPKFVTLTLKHTNAPLEHQIKHLYLCFRKLRLRREFRVRVHGGIWFFQVKKSKNDHQWHPHLHCLISGKYLPHSLLKSLWVSITYSSTVVDIRPVRDPKHAAQEAARYAATPGNLAALSLDDGIELVECMHGRRICGTWGEARSVSLRPAKLADKINWINIGSWAQVMSTRDTDHNAEAIIHAWKNNQVLPRGIDCCPSYSIEEISRKYDWQGYDFDSLFEMERSPP